MKSQNPLATKEDPISGGVGDKAAIGSAPKPSPEAIRAIRGKYAYLRISVDEFMAEKRQDAEGGY